jgi:outer membrane protein
MRSGGSGWRGAIAAAPWLLGVALGLVPGVALAEIKIGYIDSARIFAEYKPAQEAQAQFDRQVQGWRAESSEKEKAVNALRAEVRDQSPILSAVKRQEKEEALQRAISDYERFIQDVWGPSGRAVSENERATADIVRQIRAVVEKVAQQQALTLVLDAASGFVVYADRTLDITPAVLTELAAQLQAGGAH